MNWHNRIIFDHHVVYAFQKPLVNCILCDSSEVVVLNEARLDRVVSHSGHVSVVALHDVDGRVVLIVPVADLDVDWTEWLAPPVSPPL